VRKIPKRNKGEIKNFIYLNVSVKKIRRFLIKIKLN